MTTLRILLLLLAAGLSWSGALHAADAAGKIIFASGEASARGGGGQDRELKRGAPVYSGDTLITGEGRIQVRFSDGGFVSVQPNSRFAIDAYRFGADAADDKSSFKLLKGGLRAVTGTIGVRSKETYSVETPVATIGVRGTAYSALYCEGDCPPVDGTAPADGLYVGTGAGTIIIANAFGTLDVTAGQAAYVPALNLPPQPLDTPPLLVQAGGGDGGVLNEPQLLMGDQVDEGGGPVWHESGGQMLDIIGGG